MYTSVSILDIVTTVSTVTIVTYVIMFTTVTIVFFVLLQRNALYYQAFSVSLVFKLLVSLICKALVSPFFRTSNLHFKF